MAVGLVAVTNSLQYWLQYCDTPKHFTSLYKHTLAHIWPRCLCKSYFFPVVLLMLCKVREDEEQVLLVVLF